MTFRIEFLNGGEPAGGWDHPGPLDVAQHAARLALKHREATFVHIVDVDGSCGEVWSAVRDVPGEADSEEP